MRTPCLMHVNVEYLPSSFGLKVDFVKYTGGFTYLYVIRSAQRIYASVATLK